MGTEKRMSPFRDKYELLDKNVAAWEIINGEKKRLRTAAFDCKTGLSERTSGEEASFLMRYI